MVVGALAVCGVRYGDGDNHAWDGIGPLGKGLPTSRQEAHNLKRRQPCFAVGGSTARKGHAPEPTRTSFSCPTASCSSPSRPPPRHRCVARHRASKARSLVPPVLNSGPPAWRHAARRRHSPAGAPTRRAGAKPTSGASRRAGVRGNDPPDPVTENRSRPPEARSEPQGPGRRVSEGAGHAR